MSPEATDIIIELTRRLVAAEARADLEHASHDEAISRAGAAWSLGRRLAVALARRVVADATGHLGNLEVEQIARASEEALNACPELLEWRRAAYPTPMYPLADDESWSRVLPEVWK